MDLKQPYRPSYQHAANYQIVRTKAPKEVFLYRELNGKAVKHHGDDDMVLTNTPIQ
jgi:hypothetical protein